MPPDEGARPTLEYQMGDYSICGNRQDCYVGFLVYKYAGGGATLLIFPQKLWDEPVQDGWRQWDLHIQFGPSPVGNNLRHQTSKARMVCPRHTKQLISEWATEINSNIREEAMTDEYAISNGGHF